MSRCDLHIHSRFSARSEEWLFRRLDFPDSYSDPVAIHTGLVAAGMDFVTITDHDTIEGCLTIQHLRNTFISEQVTTYFAHDPCKIHLLVWGHTEAEHAEIARRRDNIIELQQYLAERDLAHAVAHPLYSINGKLSVSHLERLILLFKHFEGINGLRDSLLSELTGHVFGGLTPARIEEFADRHDLPPTHPEPWRKVFTGGSDDHGGMFGGTACTETPPAADAAEFLRHVRDGNCTAHGTGGTPLALSHGFYHMVSCYIQDRFNDQLGPGAVLVEKMFSRFMEGRDPTEFSLKEKIGFVTQGVLSGKLFDLARPGNVSLWKELSSHFARPEVKALLEQEMAAVDEPERRTFVMANLVCEQLAFRLFEKFVRQIRAGNVVESVQALSGMVPILVVLAPYIYGFHSQAPSRKWLREVCSSLGGSVPPLLQNRKRAWFTDTLDDVNGVANTIRKMSAAAKAAGEELVVVTSANGLHVADGTVMNFRPIGDFELPEYELQKLSFPPILQILDYVQRERFTEIIISTPGPLGLTGMLAAKMLNLQISAIYHTDFPEYIRILTEDRFLESLAWSYMHWFYGQADTVLVNSEQYRRSWIDRGFSPDKLNILPRGLDLELFDASRRDPKFWDEFGCATADVRLLYVGRLSKEKDLDVIAATYQALKAELPGIALSVVGHGPYAEALQQMLPDACFTGRLEGEKLAVAYASADIFVFPSTTDTFGNVVIEAQASGLPVIVSDIGGPKELVRHGKTGLITKGRDVEDFSNAVRALVTNPQWRKEIGNAARESVVDRSWPTAFRAFWEMTNR